MQPADKSSVLGNFDGASFSYGGIASKFFRRDGKFFVKTDGPNGKLDDYEIRFTFGVWPLQQYLVELPNGRLQALSIAWDAREKKDGGQRWFHLYPKERITHDDELHWTRPAQNWNFMCADCHSTELQKNYDTATDSFKTKWAEINVSCEACHGPGSSHVKWAKSNSSPFKKGEAQDVGLTVRLDERRDVSWTRAPANSVATRSRPRMTEREIEVCAQCHARRGQIAEGYVPGRPFLDYYRPALLTSSLYHADGQQRDEVYIWGSFLQSKMYANGVTCSDCHNPHSGKLRADGNQVCLTCHDAAKYDAVSHHHHKLGSAGASCSGCHMPTTTYMVIDPRHDHSLRVPRPDQTIAFGTPNACNNCHRERDARWAAGQMNQWYGHAPQGFQRFAGAFATIGKSAPDAQAQLRAIAADSTQPTIARATALSQLNASLDQAARESVAAGLKDRNPLIRLGALQSLASTAPETRAALASPLLADPLRVLRIDAVSLLAAVPQNQLNSEQSAAFERAAAEYIESQRYNADRAEGRVNLGTFYAARGDMEKSVAELEAAIKLNANFV
ncbi:MAG TPA: cytochrome c3 family protein, partial [Burkholderiales bacterium]|nr:cytochrome c3 family protein [Burkholderiales bacterium]